MIFLFDALCVLCGGVGRERVWGLCWDGAGAGGIGCGYGYGWDADMKFSQLVN